MTRIPRVVLRLSAALAVALVALLASASAFAATVRVGTPAALPSGVQSAGEAAPTKALQLTVVLQPNDPEALERFATEVSTPGSPIYGDYLSVEEFADRFGATSEGIATVREALEARGLAVGAVGANHLSLPVSATVAEVESAFALSIERVDLPSGRVAYANDRAPAVPAVAAPYVQVVVGLSNASTPEPAGAAGAAPRADQAAAVLPGAGALDPQAAPASATTTTARPSVVTGGPQPCEAAAKLAAEKTTAGSSAYTADQIADAYQFSALYGSGNFGAGQAVALLEFEPTLESDIAEYQSCYKTGATVTYKKIRGGTGPYKGEDGESALDIEQVIGLAPGAEVIVYEAPNEAGDAAEYEILGAWIGEDRAKVMSSSWGNCEPEAGMEASYFAAEAHLLEEAAAQGQSFFAASGDNGASDCYAELTEEEIEEGVEEQKELAVDAPPDEPFATAVGGTRMTAAGPSPTEYVWNEGPEGGASGGGLSEEFPIPSYQQSAAPGLGVAAAAAGFPCSVAGGTCREVPDVAADASPASAYVVYTEETWQATGGTSASAPLWAAMTALVNAAPACGGRPVGFVNPALYAIAGADYGGNFHDIVAAAPGGAATNNLFGGPQYPVHSGYDLTTGLGSPIAPALAASLCAAVNPPVAPPEETPVTPAPPAPGPPAPSSSSSATPPAAPTPKPGAIGSQTLTGIAAGKPQLSFSLTAATGGSIKSVKLKLPAGLTVGPKKKVATGIVVSGAGKVPVKASGSGSTLQITLTKPVPAATFKVGPPTILASPALVKRARSHSGKLKVAVLVAETGGTSSFTIAAKQ